MSSYQGNIITKSPATPTGPVASGRAPGMWKLDEVAYWIKQGVWPNPSIIPDQYFPYVSLLLSTTSLGNANNNLFVDSSGAFNPISRNGNTTQGSFTPYGASWSNYFDGSGDYLTVPSNTALTFGTGDFTVEFWINVPSFANFRQHVSTRPSDNASYWSIDSKADGTFYFYTDTFVITTAVQPANTWLHIAAVRASGTLTLYVNGVSQGSASLTNNFLANTLGIGAGPSGAQPTVGYISNLRLVKGTAVYTGNFTPPTAPLTAITNTSLLTCQSNRFRDASTNNFTISAFGNTSVTEFSPFAPAYPGIVYNQSDITNWSGYFDGTGDYLNTAASSSLGLTGDWTVEGWLYQTSTAGAQIFLDTRGSGATGFGIYCSLTGYAGGPGAIGYANNAALVATSSTAIPLNTWTHLAFTRSGNTVTGYINGVSAFTYTESRTLSSTMSYFIGADYLAGSNAYGYFSNFRVVRGTAVYTGNFTPPTAPLTAISGTSLLTLQNAAFTDNSTNNFIITPFGNTTVTGNSPFNTVGYWSNYFDGSGDYLTAPDNAALQLGSSNFTIEFWVNFSVVPGAGQGATLVSKFDTSNTGYEVILYNNTMYFQAQTANIGMTYAFTPTAGTWYHIAWTRNGANAYGFINGALVASTAAASGSITNLAQALQIGRRGDNTFYLTGYMSNVRVVKGTAVYTAAFTVPTTPLTAITNTSLLTCQASRFIDNSTNNFTITVNGNPSVQSFDPFYTSTIASNGGSMYFDGTGDWLTVSNSPSIQFGANAFTVEFWANVSTSSGFRGIVGKGGAATGWAVFIDNSNFWAFSIDNLNYAGSVTPIYGSWTHVALVRSGTTFTLYINGTSVRTQTSSSSFTQTEQLVIGAGRDLTIPYTGYISNLRITAGTALYTAAFTPPTSVLTPSANTTLLVNGMNAGAYDATAINDMETVGNAQVSTVQSKFGGSSIYVPSGGGCALIPNSQPLVLGSGNWTVEFWAYTDASGTKVYLDALNAANTTFQMEIYSAGTNLYWVKLGGTVAITATGALTANTWQHIAVAKSGSSTRLFVNGTQVGSTYTDNDTYNSARWEIGGRANLAFPIVGYLDDFRITNGVARYTANFTPPTQAFPPY